MENPDSGHNPELWIRLQPRLQTDFLVRDKERLREWLGDINGLKVCESGCADGYLARQFSDLGTQVEAFDRDPAMLQKAEEIEGELPKGITYRKGELLEIDTLYPPDSFDVVVISGLICFLDATQILDAFTKAAHAIKPGGRLMVATNHTRSFFEKGKSNWIEYVGEPDLNAKTQKVHINFYTPEHVPCFEGEIYFHTPEQISIQLQKAGFAEVKMHEPLASVKDMNNSSHMWIDEERIPFHLVVVAQKAGAK